ncbi:hypothetical protein ACFWPX_29650 [Nocardia sp. NPDC058518]|uniref:hypothetical protein n=1 Tax=Nocardia sp. NPDC058518 TaxID=3346534 RepID=UPI0036618CD5
MVHIDPATPPSTKRAWDCREDPGEFACPADVAAVDRVHGGHGPDCLPAIAAYAYVSDGTDY